MTPNSQALTVQRRPRPQMRQSSAVISPGAFQRSRMLVKKEQKRISEDKEVSRLSSSSSTSSSSFDSLSSSGSPKRAIALPNKVPPRASRAPPRANKAPSQGNRGPTQANRASSQAKRAMPHRRPIMNTAPSKARLSFAPERALAKRRSRNTQLLLEYDGKDSITRALDRLVGSPSFNPLLSPDDDQMTFKRPEKGKPETAKTNSDICDLDVDGRSSRGLMDDSRYSYSTDK